MLKQQAVKKLRDQFVYEAWFHLGGRRAYALINPDCTDTGRVSLVTPFRKSPA